MNLLKDCIINGHPGFCLIFILGKYKGFQAESLLKMSPSSPSIKEFGLDGVRKIAPEENCPQSGSGFGLGLALELGLGDNFPRGQFS